MSPNQEQHLDRLNLKFIAANSEKYRNGAAEHEGNLADMELIDLAYNLREEAIDQFNYAQTLIDNLEMVNSENE